MKTIIILAGIIIIVFALATGRGLSHLTQKLPKNAKRTIDAFLNILFILIGIFTVCFIFF